uniref:Uncharacterized protein n=1 Tax=Anguilla anguilla TaxID=7936 RepID=A0A0E9SUA3_ANGAN
MSHTEQSHMVLHACSLRCGTLASSHRAISQACQDSPGAGGRESWRTGF